MENKNKTTATIKEREFIITQTFNALQSLVWKAFTESDHISKRWDQKSLQ